MSESFVNHHGALADSQPVENDPRRLGIAREREVEGLSTVKVPAEQGLVVAGESVGLALEGDLKGRDGRHASRVPPIRPANRGVSTLTTHGECGNSWKQRGNRTGHCSGCHETFEGLSLFDAHRKGGVCADPRQMVVNGAPLRFDGTHGDGSWSARNTFAEAMTRANQVEARKPQNEDQREAVLTVGEHDPIVMAGLGAVWVECECSWIGPSCYTEAAALKSHAKHVEMVSS